MRATRKALYALLAIGLTGTVAGLGSYAAFSTTTANTGNSVSSGTVALADSDSGAAMFSVTGMKPTTPAIEKCIKVDYSGALDAGVKLYTTSSIGSLGQYLNLAIRPGTGNPTFPSCTGFTPDAADLFSGTLASFAGTYSSYASGLADNPASATKWVTNDSVVYRFTLTLQNNTAAEGLSTGSFAITWEARNQ